MPLVPWTEESEGIYKASYTAHLIGDKLTAQLTMPGWQTKHSDAFSIAGDKDTAKIAAMQITANNAVARRDHNTVAVTVRDVHQKFTAGTKCYLHGREWCGGFCRSKRRYCDDR